MKIIIDTNLWISFLIAKNFGKLDNIILSGEVSLLFSKELLDEIWNVVHRPKMRRYFDENASEILLQIFTQYAEIIDVTSNVEICRDAKDNFLLALALDGDADVLVTGDQDLLEIVRIGNTEILTIKQFEQRNNAS